jgi:hypothetical protein
MHPNICISWSCNDSHMETHESKGAIREGCNCSVRDQANNNTAATDAVVCKRNRVSGRNFLSRHFLTTYVQCSDLYLLWQGSQKRNAFLSHILVWFRCSWQGLACWNMQKRRSFMSESRMYLIRFSFLAHFLILIKLKYAYEIAMLYVYPSPVLTSECS